MSEDSEDGVDFVSLGSTPRELEAMGYSRTNSDCNRDECDGNQWHCDHNTVCDSCSTVVETDSHDAMILRRTVWEQFSDGSRPSYRYSGRVRMVGGFGSRYDTVDEEETFENPHHDTGSEYHL